MLTRVAVARIHLRQQPLFFFYSNRVYVAHFHPLKSNSCRFQNVILI